MKSRKIDLFDGTGVVPESPNTSDTNPVGRSYAMMRSDELLVLSETLERVNHALREKTELETLLREHPVYLELSEESKKQITIQLNALFRQSTAQVGKDVTLLLQKMNDPLRLAIQRSDELKNLVFIVEDSCKKLKHEREMVASQVLKTENALDEWTREIRSLGDAIAIRFWPTGVIVIIVFLLSFMLNVYLLYLLK